MTWPLPSRHLTHRAIQELMPDSPTVSAYLYGLSRFILYDVDLSSMTKQFVSFGQTGAPAVFICRSGRVFVHSFQSDNLTSLIESTWSSR